MATIEPPYYENATSITDIKTWGTNSTLTYTGTRGRYTYYRLQHYNYVTVKKETKKERITRVSKEIMHASWGIKQQVHEKVYKVIQVCKPRHIIQQR